MIEGVRAYSGLQNDIVKMLEPNALVICRTRLVFNLREQFLPGVTFIPQFSTLT